MSKKCNGCGALLQSGFPSKEGYIKEELLIREEAICERCFKLKNYGTISNRSEKDFTTIFKHINTTKDLVIYITDLLNLEFIDTFTNPTILVLSKKDILPKSVRDHKLKEYIKKNIVHDNIVDTVILSSVKNYNMDTLYKRILKYKRSNNVYVVGNTNAGKSTFINKFVKNYSKYTKTVTTSLLPGTTLDTVKIKINDEITLIDTPGITYVNNIQSDVDLKELNKIIPKKEIKPVTYQIDSKQTLIIDDLVRIDYVEGEKNIFTIYVSNELDIHRSKIDKNERLKDLEKRTFNISNKDIVINGLGWIKVNEAAEIDIYLPKEIDIKVREPLI